MVNPFWKYGSGRGDGRGDGSGYGSGYGDGNGSGSGSGSGYGDGSGSGSGSGYGDGNGSGYGDGDGDGSGYGSGSGYGYGNGSGYGYGSGSGYGDGSGIKGYFAIDNILCKLLNQKRGSYKVETFPQRKICYLVDYQGKIAHGDTLREAQKEAKRKYFSGLTFEENKKRFLQEFGKKHKLSGKALYEWHGILTGSCKFGRDRFCEQHNIDLRKKYTIGEFVEIVKDDFGGDKIKQLLGR